MAVSLTISIDQNSQSITNNTSNVTVTVRASWTYGSYNELLKKGTLTIDGTKYSFTSSFNTGNTTSGTGTLFTKTVDVPHNSDGSKTLVCSATYITGVSSGTISASATKVLTTIPRKSTLAVSNGTLGNALTLTVTRLSTSFTHTITYACGSASGTICTKSSSTTIQWAPPLSLASQNTTGTSVSITFTITTYNGNTSVGSNTKSISCSIPTSVKPSCTLTVSDSTGYATTYGGYLKGLSRLNVTVTPTLAYGSPITSYKTIVNGRTYTTASFTTGVLTYSDVIVANVTDQRGRVGSKTLTVNILDYTAPNISHLSVKRCDSNGTENDQGEYVQVQFSGTVTSLSNKNTATYTLEYKKTTDSEYTSVVLSALNNHYSVTNSTYIFAADSSSSYNVRLTIEDDFSDTSRTTSASTGFTLMHYKSNGHGMGIGKLSELDNVLDIGFATKFTGGIQNEVLEKISDLNDVLIPNTYVSINQGATSYSNCPITSGTFVLEVMSAGAEGQVFQRLTSTFKVTHQVFERHYYHGTWGDWVCVHSDTGWVDLTLADGITVGTEFGYLKGRLKNGVLYIKGDVAGVTASWQQIASVPSTLISGLGCYHRFGAVYNMSNFCGMLLNTNGALNVTSNSTGTWLNKVNIAINQAIHI